MIIVGVYTMKKHRIKIIVVLVFLVAISSFMYFDAFATLTSYESIVEKLFGKILSLFLGIIMCINQFGMVP